MSKKISELTAAGALTGAELVEVVQSGSNKKTTAQAIADLGSGSLLTATTNISSAQILNSNSVPIVLIANPGANMFIRPIDITMKYTFVSAAYATNTSLLFMYSALVAAAVDAQPSSVLTQVNDRVFMTGGISPTGVPQGYNGLTNQGIVLYTQTGNPTGGSGTIRVIVTYQVFDFS
jgi:hypothetical protein